MIFKNSKVYDYLKWIATVVLPALLTCYGAIAKLCEIPHTSIVLGIGVAVITCFDTILGISSVQYQKVSK